MRQRSWKTHLTYALSTFLAAIGVAQAGVFNADFNTGLPPGTAVFGSAYVASDGGVNNSGVLRLTENVNSQRGSWIISDLDAGAPVRSFEVTFKVRLGEGTSRPADGMSFCVASDLPDADWSEEGAGSGLIVAIDIYDNTDGNPFDGVGEAPAIDIKWGGTTVFGTNVPLDFLLTGGEFWEVTVRMDPDGTLDLIYNNTPVFMDRLVPGFTPIANARYGFGARTGGLNANHWIDDVTITTDTGPFQLRFTQEPMDITLAVGEFGIAQGQLFADLNNPLAATSLQWQSRFPGDPDFIDLFGANSLSLLTDLLTPAESGIEYRLIATGEAGSITSRVATVTIVDLQVPTDSDYFYGFDDGLVPLEGAVYGSAQVTFDGGVFGGGVLRLTEAVNDQNGAFVLEPIFHVGVPISGFVAKFKVNVGENASAVPADGWSFNWATDLPNDVFGAQPEEGAGTGLTVSFDTYDNDDANPYNETGEAPSIDVKWQGEVLASRKLPLGYMLSSPEFWEVVIWLHTNGTVDVVLGGLVVHTNVALPNFIGLANARFGWAARTGGANEKHYVDEISLLLNIFEGQLAFTRHPQDASVLVGRTATFTVEVNDPANATYQWQRKGPTDTDFTDIPGATSATYVTDPTVPEDDGAQFRCVATGPENTATSAAATLHVLDLTRPTNPNVCFNFDDGQLPAGTEIYGTAFVDLIDGVGGSGSLKLTINANDQNGAFVINNFNGLEAIDGFTAAFDVRAGGGTAPPADGFSFSVGPDVVHGTFGDAENGTGSGLVVAFDTFDNGGGEAPAVDIKWGGVFIGHTNVPLSLLRTGDEYREVLIRANPNGTLDVAVGGQILYEQFPLPGAQPAYGVDWVLAARTGGLNENYWMDNICIETHRYLGPVAFVDQPDDQLIMVNGTASFSASVNDPSRVATYQWQQKAPGDTDFMDIPGATAASYTTPPLLLADSGTQFRLVVTDTDSNTIISDVATLTVIDIPLGTPTAFFDFDDGLVPPGASLYGTAQVTFNGGVLDSGVLRLTEAVNGQMGTMIVNDLNAGERVSGLLVAFDVQVGGGTAVPADGFSFVWASNLPEGTFGEDGAGNGLVISFDTYDNDDGNPYNEAGEAPAIDVRWRSTDVARARVPLDLLLTDPGTFARVIIRVSPNGLIDVVYDNHVIFYQLPLPNYQGIAGGRFAWGARTGGLNANHWLDNIHIETSVAPLLSIARENGNIVITFEGVLESAPNVTGPFTEVTGAVAPTYIVPADAPPMLFFRARRP